MVLLCDTNIVLDVLMRRDPFYTASSQVLNMIESGDAEGYITANSIADIYYIVRRATSSKDSAYSATQTVLRILKPCSVTDNDITVAMAAHGADLEDNIIEACAIRNGFDYVVTRNTRHFGKMGVVTVTPEELLDKYCL